ncbi:MAG: sulfatase [Myxococcota bacterium]
MALLGCAPSDDTPLRDTPDVYLITLDTTRPDHLGIYGYPRDTSPALDAFASEAKVYERAWSTAPWTLPAHASMLTGQYPSSHGAHYVRDRREGSERRDGHDERGPRSDARNAPDPAPAPASLTEVLPFVPKNNYRANRLAERHETLAEILARRGYATGAFAAGHWLAPAFGLLQGYDHQDAHVPKLAGRPAREMTSAAIGWLEKLPAEKPAHLLINYFDPHDPHNPADAARLSPTSRTRPPSDPYADRVDRYDAEIRIMDREIGRFLDALREMNRFDNAVIIFVADHGELFGEHGRENHGPWLDEELVRVPLLIRFPSGRDGGSRVKAPISIVDLLPIVAAEVGFPLPASAEGSASETERLILSETRSSDFHVRKFGAEVARDLQSAVEWPWKLVSASTGEQTLFRLDAENPASPVLEDMLSQSERDAVQRLRQRLQAVNTAFANQAAAAQGSPAQEAQPDPVSRETEANLRALGYIE